ncbi:MAG: phosphopeptide-binding protein [Candidatus Angelobacter sp. Gp1-AA117]|nr:MAG: phosphopeptide-binding protein [Candidatus Angelobacter sp. Gp1-AA117]
MKVTLENETGKIGAKVVISSGELLRIGRNAPAELTGGEDRFMSGSHFLIECNQNRCRVADMGSRNGTLVNGNQIKEAVLRHGDLIFAGQSRFRVCIEDNPSVPQPEPVPDATAALANETLVLNDKPKDLREVLSPPPGEHLYAILDAARDDRVLEVLHNSQERYQSLYEGQQGEDLANFAPYLVEIPKDSPLLDTLLKEGWGNSWGIYLTSVKPFEGVRKHFRHFLLVETEDGKLLYFRFYDPRVLRAFLPTCNSDESSEFFGPIHDILTEESNVTNLLSFSTGEHLVPRQITLSAVQNPEG